jgi:hypothetical protein
MTSAPGIGHPSTRPPAGAGYLLRGDRVPVAGSVWRPVVEVFGLIPTVSETLARCGYFLVDGECGCERGVVGEVLTNGAERPTALVLLQGWGRRREVLPIAEILEISPDERRLIVRCPSDHRRGSGFE